MRHKENQVNLIDMGLIECSHCNLTFFTLEECKRHMDASGLESTINHHKVKYEDSLEYVDDRSLILLDEQITIKEEDFSDEGVMEENQAANLEGELEESTLSPQEPLNIESRLCSRRTLKEEEKPTINFDDFDGELLKINGSYTCPCKKFQTKYRSNYVRHLKIIHNVKADRNQGKVPFEAVNIDEDSLVCLKCSRKADNQLHLVLHMALDHVEQGNTFTCPKPGCRYETCYKKHLQEHLIDVHKLKENNFYPLEDVHVIPYEFSFVCSKCSYETENEALLKVHDIYSHLKDADGPFQCPWPKCVSQFSRKSSLKRHLNTGHSIDDDDPSGGWDAKEHLFLCRNCGHKSQTELQMTIHSVLSHHPKHQSAFACPTPQCFFATVYKPHLKRHLKGVHELGDEEFWDYGIIDPQDSIKSIKHEDVSEDDIEQPEEGFQGIDVIDYKYIDEPLSKNTNKRHNCQFCGFSSNHMRSVQRHRKVIHGKHTCDICKIVVNGKHQLFWHYSLVHRVKTDSIYWTLVCAICFCKVFPEDCYSHGFTHKCSTVTFRTLRSKVPTGRITFRYTIHEQKDFKESGVKIRKSSNHFNADDIDGFMIGEPRETEYYVAPCAKKVVDCTMSNNEELVSETLLQLQKTAGITNEFADDNKIGIKNNGDSNANLRVGDDLLIMKSEFLACEECSYETKNASLLKIHMQLMHASWATGEIEKYRCPEWPCLFTSQYRENFKRHVINVHKFKYKDLRLIEENEYSREVEVKIEVDEDEALLLEENKIKSEKICGKLYKGNGRSSNHLDSDPDWDPMHEANEINYKKMCGKPSKNNVQDSDPDWDPTMDPDHRYPKQKYRYPKTRCSYSTAKASNLLSRDHRHRSILKYSKMKYVCPSLLCLYTTERKPSLKKHLEVFHVLEKSVVSEMEGVILSMKTFMCSICDYQAKDMEEFKIHFRARHKWCGIREQAAKKNLEELNVWCLKCVMCPYETSSKQAAYAHGYDHYNSGHITKGIFYKYYRDQQPGVLTFRYSNKKRPQCNKCQYVGLTADPNLLHHNRKCARNRQARKIKRMSTGTKPLVKESDVAVAREGQVIEDSCSLEELQQIIEVTSNRQPNNAENKIDTIRISHLENDEYNKYTRETQIIRIEIIESSNEEVNIPEENDRAELNPFITEFMLGNESKNNACLRIKCKNKGCKYSSGKAEDILQHAQSCEKKKTKTGFHDLSRTILKNKKSLQSHTGQHENHSQVMKSKPKKQIGNKEIPDMFSYKCCMCGGILLDKKSLKNHTYIHAREDGNFNLEVKYSIYKGDVVKDLIAIKADSNYVPVNRTCSRRERSPVLEYNPNLSVFSCQECNFKSNVEADLTKHKSLHWSAEKEEAFRAQKWYTCGVCFFHCFDMIKFIEHSEKHRKRPSLKLNLKINQKKQLVKNIFSENGG